MKVVLALIALQLVVSVRSLPLSDLLTFCDGKADGYYCASCLQPVYCNATNTPPATELPTCTSNKACETFSTTLASCVWYDSATSCACNSSYATFCDPYNDHNIASCSSYSIEDVTPCYEEGVAECLEGVCVAPASCSEVANGTWVRYYPVCRAGYQCESGQVATEKTCGDSEYLADDGSCLTAPPAPCSNNCYGNCPDETSCSRYYFCDGQGGVLSGPFYCQSSSSPYFNPHANPPMCENDPSMCVPLTACDF